MSPKRTYTLVQSDKENSFTEVFKNIDCIKLQNKMRKHFSIESIIKTFNFGPIKKNPKQPSEELKEDAYKASLETIKVHEDQMFLTNKGELIIIASFILGDYFTDIIKTYFDNEAQATDKDKKVDDFSSYSR